MRYIPDDNLSYPVLIQLENGGTGSGFFLRAEHTQYLVTAKHVFFEKKEDGTHSLRCSKAKLVCYTRDITVTDPIITTLDLLTLQHDGQVKFHVSDDVSIIKIAEIQTTQNTAAMLTSPISGVIVESCPVGGVSVAVPKEYFKPYSEVLVSNEVFIFGYPSSLSLSGQIDYLRPLLRKGIVAGKNDAKKSIILDCPVYYGNSGGLVIEVEQNPLGQRKFHAIGIVSEYVPFVEQLLSVQHKTINTNMENSGYSVVVPIDRIMELLV